MPNRLEGLQAARAIAALSVAYFHSYVALRGFPEAAQSPIEGLKAWGFLGVDFFFAISGYVICLVVTRSSFSLRAFAIKRLFRLYPMYWTAMAVILLMIVTGKYRTEGLGHFLYSMTLLPQPGPSAYDPSWTLERELVFYALAAIIVPIGGVRALAAALATLAALGWYLGNPWSLHLISTVQADFLAGTLIFMLHARLRAVGSLFPFAIGAVGLWYTRSHDFTFSVALCMGVLLLSLVNLSLPWRRAPFRWLLAVGDASYSVYLLHYIVFYYAAVLSVQFGGPLPDWLCEPWRYASLLACCAISWLTWRAIERPMIELGGRIADADWPSLGRERKAVETSGAE